MPSLPDFYGNWALALAGSASFIDSQYTRPIPRTEFHP